MKDFKNVKQLLKYLAFVTLRDRNRNKLYLSLSQTIYINASLTVDDTEAFVDSLDQDQTAQNIYSDL